MKRLFLIGTILLLLASCTKPKEEPLVFLSPYGKGTIVNGTIRTAFKGSNINFQSIALNVDTANKTASLYFEDGTVLKVKEKTRFISILGYCIFLILGMFVPSSVKEQFIELIRKLGKLFIKKFFPPANTVKGIE